MQDAINATIAVFPPMLDELSHRRAEAINEISAMRRYSPLKRSCILAPNLEANCQFICAL